MRERIRSTRAIRRVALLARAGGRPCLAAAFALVAAGSLAAHAQFASRVTLVEVYATVADARGHPVSGLTRGDFRVLDAGEPCDVEVFAASDFPLSVAIAIDRSWSMAGRRIEQARTAAGQFLRQLRDQDESMLIGISSEVETLAPLSRDRAAQHAAVDGLTPWGSTRLHDALLEAMSRIEVAHGRRALVVLSDGQDRGSRATAAQVVDRAHRTPVLIYPVSISRRNSSLLAQMAAFTGGRAFWLREPDQLGEAFSAIAQELRQQYLLGYRPPASSSASAASAWRRITVETPGRSLRVRARPGYYAGTAE
jgi:Ca-activated chloride channel family protein